MVKSKYYPGWSWLDNDDIIDTSSDVVVDYDSGTRRPRNPNTHGFKINPSYNGLELRRSYLLGQGQSAYRRIGPMKLAMNAIHSEPVPLP